MVDRQRGGIDGRLFNVGMGNRRRVGATASSTRGLSGSTERITMLHAEQRDLRSSPWHGGMLVAGIR
jgi:hypothetical protein